MVLYTYRCAEHGEFDTTNRGDSDFCEHCGNESRRVWRLRIHAESARHAGRWDPVVGQYVQSEREFRSVLARGQEDQSKRLNMDVTLATVDARDQEGLAELHGYTTDQRAFDLEGEAKAKRDRQAT